MSEPRLNLGDIRIMIKSIGCRRGPKRMRTDRPTNQPNWRPADAACSSRLAVHIAIQLRGLNPMVNRSPLTPNRFATPSSHDLASKQCRNNTLVSLEYIAAPRDRFTAKKRRPLRWFRLTDRRSA